MPNYRTEMLKLEATARAEEIKRKQAECRSLTQTSRFQQQHRYIPYFWDKFVNQGADDCEDVVTFMVTDTDRMFFPELRKKRSIKLFTACGRVMEC